ncbi:MAG: hypothetical protein QJR00_03750, partial [Bacillota bacterium]|nr:hypothetical protein [Bacillota bacterium]
LRVKGVYEKNAFTWTMEPSEVVFSLAEGSSTGKGHLVVVLPPGARDVEGNGLFDGAAHTVTWDFFYLQDHPAHLAFILPAKRPTALYAALGVLALGALLGTFIFLSNLRR